MVSTQICILEVLSFLQKKNSFVFQSASKSCYDTAFKITNDQNMIGISNQVRSIKQQYSDSFDGQVGNF